MTIFITGITGFVGRHLAHRLVSEGFEVAGLARYVSTRNKNELPDISIYYGDIRDPDSLHRIFEKTEPGIIVHLAAQTSVEYSFSHPKEVYETNFLGVTNIVSEALKVNPDLDKFIFANSVEVYGNQQVFPIKENAPLKPASPYGVSKVAAEYYLKYLCEGYGFPCVILRSTNTYGRKYNHYFVIEHIIYDMLKGEKRIAMGDPTPVRDFLFIDDEVEAYIDAIKTTKRIFGEPVHTGTGRGISIRELFELIREFTDSKAEPVWGTISKRPYEINKLVFDITKIRKLLGWTPKFSLEDGLKTTIDWWENYLDRRNK